MKILLRYLLEDIDKRTYVRIGIKNQSAVNNKSGNALFAGVILFYQSVCSYFKITFLCRNES